MKKRKLPAACLERWIDSVSSSTLPLLAGFSTTSVIVVSDDATRFRCPGMTILFFTIATVVLIAAVQCAYHARISLSVVSRDGSSAHSRAPLIAPDTAGPVNRQQGVDYQRGLKLTKTTRWTYDIGLLALLAGLCLAVAPLRAATGAEAYIRWAASAIALCAAVAELVWTVVDPLLRSELGNQQPVSAALHP
jgi:hypothetical protein